MEGWRVPPQLPRWSEHVPVVVLVALTLAGAILGYRARLAAGGHDEPVPASEPRAELAAVVDLAPRVGCDEAFDLALYSHSGVELVTWDRPAQGCRRRRVTVKYVPGRIRRSALLDRIERLAVSVRVER